MTEPKTREFDLEDRTARFGEIVIVFAKSVPVNLVTTPLIPQLVRAATSVGANYVEADEADSKISVQDWALPSRDERDATLAPNDRFGGTGSAGHGNPNLARGQGIEPDFWRNSKKSVMTQSCLIIRAWSFIGHSGLVIGH